MTTKEIKALLELCTRYGVKRVKTADIELELGGELPTYTPHREELNHEAARPLKTDSGIESTPSSEEEILFWSSQQV